MNDFRMQFLKGDVAQQFNHLYLEGRISQVTVQFHQA